MPATDILKKLSYIETEMEVQKQILHSIPSEQTAEIERTLHKIAKAKNDIAALRKEFEEKSPEEYRKLMNIENGVNAFNSLIQKKQFSRIENLATAPDCSLTEKSGSRHRCLVKAVDASGNWTIVTLDGELLTFNKSDVEESGD
ncbi:MAG TPA: hypothetical protein VJ969_00365 [Desulfopila sp.]|nr:hypothetical protein [Desulfopila sp.]